MSSVIKALNMKEAWGVYALYIMVAGAGAVTPALAAFGAAFPDADPVTISLIQSLPSLTTIIGTLFIGAVAGKKIPFKVAGIIALLVYLVFGCLPAVWNDSLTSILVARALVGFGMGMVSPLGAAIFLRLVDNKEERSKYLGRGGAMQQAGCVVLTLLGGFLCAIDWRLTFWAYGLALVALLRVAAARAAGQHDGRQCERRRSNDDALEFLLHRSVPPMSLRPDARLPWLRAPRPLFYFTALKRCWQYNTAPGKGKSPNTGMHGNTPHPPGGRQACATSARRRRFGRRCCP